MSEMDVDDDDDDRFPNKKFEDFSNLFPKKSEDNNFPILKFNLHAHKNEESEKKLNKTRSNWKGIKIKKIPPANFIVRVKRKRESDPVEEIYLEGIPKRKKRKQLSDLMNDLSLHDPEEKEVSLFTIVEEKNIDEKMMQRIKPFNAKNIKRKNIKKSSGVDFSDVKVDRMAHRDRRIKGRRLIKVQERRIKGDDDDIKIIDLEEKKNFDDDDEVGDIDDERDVDDEDVEYNYYMFKKNVMLKKSQFLHPEVELFQTYDEAEYDVDYDSEDSNNEDHYKNEYPNREEIVSSSEEDEDENEKNDDEKEDEEDDVVKDLRKIDEENENIEYLEFVQFLNDKEENKMEDEGEQIIEIKENMDTTEDYKSNKKINIINNNDQMISD